jgi:trehalose-phosphatase
VRRVGSEHWQQLVEGFDLSWKGTTAAILEAYTTRTNGATIQDKGSALVWKYDDVDPEFASMQVKELHQHLQGVLASSAVEVTMGKGYLEVRIVCPTFCTACVTTLRRSRALATQPCT